MDLKNKVVVLIGSEGLIGKTFGQGLIGKGVILVKADIAMKSETDFYVDINNEDSVQALITDVRNKYKIIDAVVCTAYPRNRNYGRKVLDVTYADFCENVNLNLGGYFLVLQRFSKYFSEVGGGNIVLISSVYGLITPKFNIYKNTSMTMPVEYTAIKSALISLSRYFAKYLKGQNVRVNCISPGGIEDGQPCAFLQAYKNECINKGMLDASDLLGALYFLLSDESKFVNGQNIIIDDGFTL